MRLQEGKMFSVVCACSVAVASLLYSSIYTLNLWLELERGFSGNSLN